MYYNIIEIKNMNYIEVTLQIKKVHFCVFCVI